MDSDGSGGDGDVFLSPDRDPRQQIHEAKQTGSANSVSSVGSFEGLDSDGYDSPGYSSRSSSRASSRSSSRASSRSRTTSFGAYAQQVMAARRCHVDPFSPSLFSLSPSLSVNQPPS